MSHIILSDCLDSSMREADKVTSLWKNEAWSQEHDYSQLVM